MLSRQVNKTVDIVFVIESLGMVRSQNNLTTREQTKMHKNIDLTVTDITLIRCLIWKFIKVTDDNKIETNSLSD